MGLGGKEGPYMPTPWRGKIKYVVLKKNHSSPLLLSCSCMRNRHPWLFRCFLQNSSKIFGAKIMNHLLLFINKTAAAHLELMGPFQNAASAFRGQVRGESGAFVSGQLLPSLEDGAKKEGAGYCLRGIPPWGPKAPSLACLQVLASGL